MRVGPEILVGVFPTYTELEFSRLRFRGNDAMAELLLTALIRRSRDWLISLALMSWLASALPAAEPTAQAITFFENEVRPLLVEKCQKCHGPRKQESGLRLDSRQALLKGGERGPAVVPGKTEQSILIAAVRQSGDLKMPPGGRLSDAQIAVLNRWVADGAAWPDEKSAVADLNQVGLNARFVAPRAPVFFPPLRRGGTGGWRGYNLGIFAGESQSQENHPPRPPLRKEGKNAH